MRLRPGSILTIRASKSSLKCGTTLGSTRAFTTTNYLHVGRSPTVRAIERNKKKFAKQDVSQSWPIEILEAAFRSGGLRLSSAAAIRILDYFRTLGRAPSKSEVKKLCEEHKIGSQDLTALAMVLSHNQSLHFNRIAKDLLDAASHLNDRSATILQAQAAVRSRKILSAGHTDIRKRLEELASTDDPAGLYLLGQVQAMGQDTKTALISWEKARGILKNSPLKEGDPIEDFGELYVDIAKLRMHDGDHGDAQDVLMEGALKNDYPASYYYLALYYEPVTSPTWLQYMLKAASSGHAEAARVLGLFYTGQALGSLPILGVHSLITNEATTVLPLFPLSSKLQQKTLIQATEWVTIGAEYGIVRCKVMLAIYLRAGGDFQKGFKLLTEAHEDQAWQSRISFYKEHWYDKEVDFVWGDKNPSNLKNAYSLKTMVSEAFSATLKDLDT